MPVVIDGNNTPTAGGIGYGDGSELAFTSAGLSGQVLTSAGSGTPTWATPSGGLTLISTTTASSSSSVVFSNLSPTAYHYYQVVAKGVTASGISNFEIQVSTDNGSTFVTSATYQSQAGGFGTSSYESARRSNGDVIGLPGTFGNGYTGHLYTNIFPNVSGQYFSANGLTWAGVYFSTQTGGMFSGTNEASTTAVNAIRFKLNSGTFSGTFKLYGVAA